MMSLFKRPMLQMATSGGEQIFCPFFDLDQRSKLWLKFERKTDPSPSVSRGMQLRILTLEKGGYWTY